MSSHSTIYYILYSTLPLWAYLLRATLKGNTLKSKENYQLVTTLTYNSLIRRRDVLLGYYPLVPSCTGIP